MSYKVILITTEDEHGIHYEEYSLLSDPIIAKRIEEIRRGE